MRAAARSATLGPFAAPVPGIRTLLVDLDGTVVAMRGRTLGLELRFMARAIRRFGRVIRPWRFRRAFWEAAEAMRHHASDRFNYDVFVERLGAHARIPEAELRTMLAECVEEDFGRLGACFAPVPDAHATLERAADLGYRLVLATNPMFPVRAVELRLGWAHALDLPFELVTHAENSTRCKPSVAYYEELLARLGEDPERCVMVGNDPEKDLPATALGVRTFLLDPARADHPLAGCGRYADLDRFLTTSMEARA